MAEIHVTIKVWPETRTRLRQLSRKTGKRMTRLIDDLARAALEEMNDPAIASSESDNEDQEGSDDQWGDIQL